MHERWTGCLLTVFLLFSGTLASAQEYPGDQWAQASAERVGMDGDKLQLAITYAQSSPADSGSGMITRYCKRVALWGEPQKTYDLKSSFKSIGATALAIADGKLTLADQANTHLPSLGITPESNLKTG